ncbi:hypothetical protein EKO27_g8990 [Xylaria grammica]|uniref:Uncharacterized protein n=1 Tax=Xylaria grammica TaxID=363999 RepID=A0A439CVB5_9PEZI|nr:hypothetical protein EKO27_g8990 [Xylaria grammica]
MDMTTAARRRRVEARAVGRTPEEHAALERALARRRARSSHASPVSRPAQAHHHHHPSQVGRGHEGHARFQFLDPREFDEAEEDDREASPPDEVYEFLRGIDDSVMYSAFKILYPGLGDPGVISTSLFYFEYAMFRAEVAAAKSGPTQPALGVPPRRKSKPGYVRRNVRGAGWHKRGYRDYGCMWINVRQGSYGHTRGTDAPENQTLTAFVQSVFGGKDSWASRYPEGWYCDLFFKKKSVTRLLVDLEKHGLDTDLVLVRDYFDGGETVYFKLFDENGQQQSHVPFG